MIQKLKSRESRIKPGLFAFLLAERIIFGKKTQGLHPKQFAIITSVVVATFFARVFTLCEFRASETRPSKLRFVQLTRAH